MEYRKYKNFAQSSKNPWRFDLPNLIDIQTKPFEWFTHNGLRELFDEISPIEDYQKKDLELYFLDYYFDEPKRTPAAAKENNLTYEAPLRCKVRLKNKRTGELKEQEIYLGDFPVMTAQGTFIINGVERILISQLSDLQVCFSWRANQAQKITTSAQRSFRHAVRGWNLIRMRAVSFQ